MIAHNAVSNNFLTSVKLYGMFYFTLLYILKWE